MCILGLMWVFGSFLFEKDNTVGAYIFTILNSLQGALVFVMHCLLSKQVGHSSSECVSECVHVFLEIKGRQRSWTKIKQRKRLNKMRIKT